MNFYKNKYNIPFEKYLYSYQWGQETLSLPLFPTITQTEQEYVVKVLLDKIEPLMGEK
jgi:UDP-4-amino-4-deoxy-L-arabinose-oxoglutarate aminotransferase